MNNVILVCLNKRRDPNWAHANIPPFRQTTALSAQLCEFHCYIYVIYSVCGVELADLLPLKAKFNFFSMHLLSWKHCCREILQAFEPNFDRKPGLSNPFIFLRCLKPPAAPQLVQTTFRSLWFIISQPSRGSYLAGRFNRNLVFFFSGWPINRRSLPPSARLTGNAFIHNSEDLETIVGGATIIHRPMTSLKWKNMLLFICASGDNSPETIVLYHLASQTLPSFVLKWTIFNAA